MNPSDGGTDPSSGAGCGDHGGGEEINAHYHHRQNHRPLWWPSGRPRRSPGAVACPSAASMEIATPGPMSVVLASVSPAACSTSWCAMGAIQIEHGHERRRAPLLHCSFAVVVSPIADQRSGPLQVPRSRPSPAPPSVANPWPGPASAVRRRDTLPRWRAIIHLNIHYMLGSMPCFKDLTNTTTKGDGAPHLQQKRGHWLGVACPNVR